MDDGEKQNLEKYFFRKYIAGMSNVGTFFQSVWIRCRSVFTNIVDRKFMESELRFVLYCGVIFWVLLLLSKKI
jgi:hypothetical protein